MEEKPPQNAEREAAPPRRLLTPPRPRGQPLLSTHGRCPALPGARCAPGRSPSPTVPLEGRGRFGLGAVSPAKGTPRSRALGVSAFLGELLSGSALHLPMATLRLWQGDRGETVSPRFFFFFFFYKERENTVLAHFIKCLPLPQRHQLLTFPPHSQ